MALHDIKAYATRMEHELQADVLSRDESRPYLEPLRESLISAFWDAHEFVETVLDSQASKCREYFDSSVVAGMVSGAFAHLVSPSLRDHNVDWRLRGRQQFGFVKEAIKLRFKKLTADLHSMNVQTKAQSDEYHQKQSSLPGARPYTRITFGYTVQPETGRGITGLYFVCPLNWTRNHWVRPLFEDDGGQHELFGGPFDSPDTEVVYPDPEIIIPVSKTKAQ